MLELIKGSYYISRYVKAHRPNVVIWTRQRCNKKARSNINGSITVEAAYILPIVILSIISLLYMAFYLHDKSTLQSMVDHMVHNASITMKHEANILIGEIDYNNINSRGVFYKILGDTEEEETEIVQSLQYQLSKRLLLYEVNKIEVEVDNGGPIRIEVVAKSRTGSPTFYKVMKMFQQIKIIGIGSIHDPAETIRISEVILETGSNIKGMDKLKESLENILKDK